MRPMTLLFVGLDEESACSKPGTTDQRADVRHPGGPKIT